MLQLDHKEFWSREAPGSICKEGEPISPCQHSVSWLWADHHGFVLERSPQSAEGQAIETLQPELAASICPNAEW